MVEQAQRYIAKRPFGYGRIAMLDRGQVFELDNQPNDEKLIRLGYVNEFPAGYETYTCAECGSEFVGTSERSAHGRERHVERDLTPQEEEERSDRQERMLAQVAPLNLDKTIASGGRVVARKITPPVQTAPTAVADPSTESTEPTT